MPCHPVEEDTCRHRSMTAPQARTHAGKVKERGAYDDEGEGEEAYSVQRELGTDIGEAVCI